jgi:hypothetical protein
MRFRNANRKEIVLDDTTPATQFLTDVGWLGPKDEMDRASHRFGKCSECHEIICVEKSVTDTQNTQPETNEMLHKAFRTHVKLKH